MSAPLSERVAIVTGAGRGLGRAMALGLAGAGVRVMALAARERPEIDALAAVNERILPHAESFPPDRRAALLSPEIIVPPLLYLCSEEADAVTGLRFNARRWRADLPPAEAALAARENAGWPGA